MNIKELYNYGKQNLIDSHESAILCRELYGFSRTDIIIKGDSVIEDSEKFFECIKRRNKGEPLQYILGYEYFDDLKLFVKDGVLIPRADTLALVDCASELIGQNYLKGLDLCSGTGVVALAIANRCKNVNIKAIELFETPFECLLENVKMYGNGRVIAEQKDIFECFKDYQDLDFIVSNPPYIESSEIPNLQIEVQNEPHTALDGGIDGLDFYKVLVTDWAKKIKKGGFLALEIGETQAEELKVLLEKNGFIDIKVTKDLAGLDRCVVGIIA